MLWKATRKERIEKLQWKESTVWNKPTLQLNFSSTWSLTTKFEYQPCPGLKSKMFNSDVWAHEENSPRTHISGTLPKEARWWPTTHQWRYRSLWFRPAFLLCLHPLEVEKRKKWAAFQKSEREWERVSLKALKQAVQRGADLCKKWSFRKQQLNAVKCSREDADAVEFGGMLGLYIWAPWMCARSPRLWNFGEFWATQLLDGSLENRHVTTDTTLAATFQS